MKLNKLSIKAQRSSGHPLKKTELIDMKRRFWVAAALSLPLFILGMTEFIPGDPIRTFVGPRAAMWVSLTLATPVVLGGLAFLRPLLVLTHNPQSQHVHVDRAGW